MDNAHRRLFLAEQKAKELFSAVEKQGLIIPGKSEKELCDEIVTIAKKDFGAEHHWGKKIARAGVNTLQPYSADPPNNVIQDGDILFF